MDQRPVRGLHRRAARRPRRPSSRSGKDTPYFEGCLPIEVMAERGRETLRFGPMKPVGLTNPHQPGVRPYAVVQLRQDNALGTLWNMVGFQTKLKHGEQAAHLPHDPGPGERASSRGSAACTATPSSTSPKLLDGALAPEGRAAAALRRPDHRRRGLRRERRHRACSPAASPRPSGSAAARRRRRRPRRSARCSRHITGGHSAPRRRRHGPSSR